jgi:hypothetical protein
MNAWPTRITRPRFDSPAIEAAQASALYSGVRSVDVPMDLVGSRFRAADGIAKGRSEAFGAILLDRATGHVVEANPDFAVAQEVLRTAVTKLIDDKDLVPS